MIATSGKLRTLDFHRKRDTTSVPPRCGEAMRATTARQPSWDLRPSGLRSRACMDRERLGAKQLAAEAHGAPEDRRFRGADRDSRFQTRELGTGQDELDHMSAPPWHLRLRSSPALRSPFT